MPQFAVIFDSDTGELRAANGSTHGPRPNGGFLISSFFSILENRALTDLDNGRRLDCLVSVTLTVPMGLSTGWNVVLMTPRDGLVITPAAGVTLNGGTVPITRAFLANIEVQVVRTASNVFTVSGV